MKTNTPDSPVAAHSPLPWRVYGSCHVLPVAGDKFQHVAHIGLDDPHAPRPVVAHVLRRDETVKTFKQAHEPDTEQAANAALIVRAVNSYDALVEALEEAERVIRFAVQESRGKVRAEIVGGWAHHANKARAALAKAKGGQS